MARFNGIAQTAEVALSAAVARTVIQMVAPANHRVVLTGWGVYFDGTSANAEPVQVEIVLQTTAGTMSALTPAKKDTSLPETLLTTAQHSASAEPTTTDVLDVIECHPQGGYEKAAPLMTEIVVGGGKRIGIRCTAPAGVNVRAKLEFEE